MASLRDLRGRFTKKSSKKLFTSVNGWDFFGNISWNTRSLDRYLEFESISYLRCAVECTRRSQCKSINYSPFTKYCELNYLEKLQSNLDSTSLRYMFLHSDSSTWNLSKIVCRCNDHNCSANSKCNLVTGSCEISDCGKPISLPGAEIVSYGHHEVGNGVLYRCREDRIMTDTRGANMNSSYSVLFCNASGLWDAPTFLCSEVDANKEDNTTDVSGTNLNGQTSSTTNKNTSITWKWYRKHRYALFSTPEVWERAKDTCLDNSAYLIKIDTTEEMEFASDLAKGEFWVGGKNGNGRNTWRWDTDNTDVTLSVLCHRYDN